MQARTPFCGFRRVAYGARALGAEEPPEPRLRLGQPVTLSHANLWAIRFTAIKAVCPTMPQNAWAH